MAPADQSTAPRGTAWAEVLDDKSTGTTGCNFQMENEGLGVCRPWRLFLSRHQLERPE